MIATNNEAQMSAGRSDMEKSRLDNLKPIGFLARRLDEALTEYVDRLLSEQHQLGRPHWQLMRRVHEQPGLTVADYVESARIFYDEARVRELIGELSSREWLRVDASSGDEAMTLSEAGEHGYEQMRRTQESTWTQLLDGLSYDDYVTVVTLIEHMIANLEKAS